MNSVIILGKKNYIWIPISVKPFGTCETMKTCEDTQVYIWISYFLMTPGRKQYRLYLVITFI